MPIRGYCKYLHLDNVPPPPAKDMIHNIREESDDGADIRCSNQRSFPMTQAPFLMFEMKYQRSIIRLQ